MNGIVNKLAELADISINVDDMICAEITYGNDSSEVPDWYAKSTAKGVLIGASNARGYVSPCITIAEFTCENRGGYFRSYTIANLLTYATRDYFDGSITYTVKFTTTNTGAQCYAYKKQTQDSKLPYLAIFLKS